MQYQDRDMRFNNPNSNAVAANRGAAGVCGGTVAAGAAVEDSVSLGGFGG
jgi:hypothetical protein